MRTNTRRLVLIDIMILIVAFFIGGITYYELSKPERAVLTSELLWNVDEDGNYNIEVVSGNTFEQDFIAQHEELECFYTAFKSERDDNGGELGIRLRDKNGEIIYSYSFPVESTRDELHIPNICSVKLIKGEKYTIVVSGEKLTEKSVIGVLGDKVNEDAVMKIGFNYQYYDKTAAMVSLKIIIVLGLLIMETVNWYCIKYSVFVREKTTV